MAGLAGQLGAQLFLLAGLQGPLAAEVAQPLPGQVPDQRAR